MDGNRYVGSICMFRTQCIILSMYVRMIPRELRVFYGRYTESYWRLKGDGGVIGYVVCLACLSLEGRLVMMEGAEWRQETKIVPIARKGISQSKSRL